MVLMGYSGARGTLIYEKNWLSKISCQTPFNVLINKNNFQEVIRSKKFQEMSSKTFFECKNSSKNPKR
jgi:hypothetical protein